MVDKRKVNSTESDAKLHNISGERQKKGRPYVRPEVLSSEHLEAAAATCDPPTGALGKTVPIPCGTMGS